MFNSQMPDVSDLPTSRQLVRSTLVAAAAAAAILVTIVMPSEYGVDPIGVGSVLGLTEMGEIKVQLAQEAEAAAAAEAIAGANPVAPAPANVASAAPPSAAPATPAAGSRTDEMSVTLAVGEAAEIKVKADKGARIGFDWSVSGGHVNYDTHADAPGVSYHGYGKGRESTGERGEIVAAFDGSHGWFWRNRSAGPVTLVLRTNGAYSEIRRVV